MDRRMAFVRTSTTRLADALALLALGAVTLSDFLLTDFWDRNAMATSVVADVFVLFAIRSGSRRWPQPNSASTATRSE